MILNLVSKEDSVDVLVNNAGYALTGAFEDLAIEEIKAQFDALLHNSFNNTCSILLDTIIF